LLALHLATPVLQHLLPHISPTEVRRQDVAEDTVNKRADPLLSLFCARRPDARTKHHHPGRAYAATARPNPTPQPTAPAATHFVARRHLIGRSSPVGGRLPASIRCLAELQPFLARDGLHVRAAMAYGYVLTFLSEHRAREHCGDRACLLSTGLSPRAQPPAIWRRLRSLPECREHALPRTQSCLWPHIIPVSTH
jgi:hypothetical protein